MAVLALRLEDAGAAALVMYSLFEEELRAEDAMLEALRAKDDFLGQVDWLVDYLKNKPAPAYPFPIDATRAVQGNAEICGTMCNSIYDFLHGEGFLAAARERYASPCPPVVA